MLDAHPEISCEFQPSILGLWHFERAAAKTVTRADASPFGGVFKDRRSETAYHARQEFLRGIELLRPDYPELVAGHLSAELRDDIRQLHRTLVRGVIDAYLHASSDKPIKGLKRYVDVDFLLSLYPAAKVVFVVRDGRDVCVSMRYHRLRQGVYYQGDERWALLRALNRVELSRRVTKRLVDRFPRLRDVLFRDLESGPLFSRSSLEKAARDWARTLNYILDCRERHPDNQMLVRYEDLLDDTSGILTEILTFLGASHENRLVDRIVEATSLSKLKQKDDRSFFRKGTSGEWRKVFTPDDVAVFKETTGHCLVRLGYESDNEWTL